MGRSWVLCVGVMATLGCTSAAKEERLDPLGWVPPPPTISAAEAGAHVGDLVAVQTRIASASVQGGQAVLRPADDAGGFVIAIAPALIGPTAQELVETYDGQEVRAVGYVSDLGGDLELLIGDPERIRVWSPDAEPQRNATAGAKSSQTASEPPKAASPKSVPAAGVQAPQAASARAVSAAGAVATESAAATPPASTEPDPACVRAREVWRMAARDARRPLRELLDCLDAGAPRCKDAAARARIALGEVAASEERLRWVCGADE